MLPRNSGFNKKDKGKMLEVNFPQLINKELTFFSLSKNLGFLGKKLVFHFYSEYY